MTWAADYRQTWIEGRLTLHGFVNRAHLVDQFKISAATASGDLQRFMRERPGAMTYDAKEKRYVAPNVCIHKIPLGDACETCLQDYDGGRATF